MRLNNQDISGINKETIATVCRKYTNLTAMQSDMLKRLNVCLPFIADLAHAYLYLYVKTQDASKLLVLKHYRPHTFFTDIELTGEGALVPAIEEPLIMAAFEKGKFIQGQREWRFGINLEMYVYPIKSGNEVVGVVSLETGHSYASSSSYYQLMDTAVFLLEHGKRGLDKDQFRTMSPGTGIIIADHSNRIVFANLSATRIYRALGITSLIGCRMSDRELSAMLHRETIDSSRPYERELQIRDIVLVQRDIKLEEAGVLQRRIMLLSDVSELRKKEREIKIKSAVIQEIHHRVKNNLQTIASLLRLQARRSKVPEVRSALQESTNRILSMSVVHEFLSQQDAEEIKVIEVTRNILNTVAPNMVASDFELEQVFDGPEVILPSRTASNLAVIINELILNSIEHGFEHRSRGLIGLHTEETADGYVLDLYDDGCGLPDDFDLSKTKSLGLQIIRTLVADDMGGEIRLFNQQGTHARITIPRNPEGGEY
ncbi:sensor histidine kinase [Anaerovibrio sp.]|uniref:sensor histidine kinase n=1 Tax=Anaerovibrio sp. TaxID=1872532 RepID=UPI003F1447ED